MPGPLHGVRVADFTWWIAGPMAAQMLGFLGAEVIKIESMNRLDGMRTLGLGSDPVFTEKPPPFERAIERRPGFHDVNLNKLSVRLDIGCPEGLQIARELVAVSDVMLEGFRPGVMEHLGLGYEAVKAIRPDIVYASIAHGGQTGPEAGMPGMANMWQAIGGIGNLTGYPDLPPLANSNVVDPGSGMSLAMAVVGALYYRRKTGNGTYIDFSARESWPRALGEAIMAYTMNGEIKTRQGNRDEIMAPHNCYPCKGVDGGEKWVTIAVATREEWVAFCEATGLKELRDDPRFADRYQRWKHQDELDAVIDGWTRQYTPQEVTQLLQGSGVAAVPNFTAQDLHEDAHIKARGTLQEVMHPEFGMRKVMAPPWRMSRTQPEVTRAAPLMGQHTEHVLTELLGKSKEQIQELIVQKVLY